LYWNGDHDIIPNIDSLPPWRMHPSMTARLL
jgi:hypothetical protein